MVMLRPVLQGRAGMARHSSAMNSMSSCTREDVFGADTWNSVKNCVFGMRAGQRGRTSNVKSMILKNCLNKFPFANIDTEVLCHIYPLYSVV